MKFEQSLRTVLDSEANEVKCTLNKLLTTSGSLNVSLFCVMLIELFSVQSDFNLIDDE